MSCHHVAHFRFKEMMTRGGRRVKLEVTHIRKREREREAYRLYQVTHLVDAEVVLWVNAKRVTSGHAPLYVYLLWPRCTTRGRAGQAVQRLFIKMEIKCRASSHSKPLHLHVPFWLTTCTDNTHMPRIQRGNWATSSSSTRLNGMRRWKVVSHSVSHSRGGGAKYLQKRPKTYQLTPTLTRVLVLLIPHSARDGFSFQQPSTCPSLVSTSLQAESESLIMFYELRNANLCSVTWHGTAEENNVINEKPFKRTQL